MSFPYTVYLAPEQERQTTSAQKLPLGTRGVTEDGRAFRYSQAGATELIAYQIQQAAAESSFTTATDQRIYYGPSGATDRYTKAGTTQVLIGGDATHTVGGATVGMGTAANDYKDGWLFIGCTSTGGVATDYMQAVRIHSHPALASSTALGSGNYIYLYPPGLLRTVSTDTFVSVKVMASPYKKVIANAITTNVAFNYGVPVGVTPCMVTASYYFWLQTWGPALVLADAAGGARSPADIAGIKATVSSGTTGAYCPPIAGSTSITTDTGLTSYHVPSIGYIMTAPPAASNYTMLMLQIAP